MHTKVCNKRFNAPSCDRFWGVWFVEGHVSSTKLCYINYLFTRNKFSPTRSVTRKTTYSVCAMRIHAKSGIKGYVYNSVEYIQPWISLPSNLIGNTQATHPQWMLVSFPDPQYVRKEGLVNIVQNFWAPRNFGGTNLIGQYVSCATHTHKFPHRQVNQQVQATYMYLARISLPVHRLSWAL